MKNMKVGCVGKNSRNVNGFLMLDVFFNATVKEFWLRINLQDTFKCCDSKDEQGVLGFT